MLLVIALYIYTGGTASAEDLFNSARDLAFLVPAILLSLTIHEFAHALVAHSLGDDTAKAQGRLTLNPIAHLDPLGTFMLIFTLLAHFGLGWAKPVPVNPRNLRPDPRIGMGVVAIAGPISNILLAFITIRLLILLGIPLSLRGGFLMAPEPYTPFAEFAQINVFLAVFNLIPIPPLDGSRVLGAIVPYPIARGIYELESIGPMLLMMLVFFGGGGGIGTILLLVVMFMFLSNSARSGQLSPVALGIVGVFVVLLVFGHFSLGSLIAFASRPLVIALAS